jgi:hypothetical protein
MNVTLRKASVLQNAINEAIRGIDIKSEIALNEFQIPEAELLKAVTEARANIARRDALNKALYAIRHAVARANHESGVNDKLTAVAETEKQIQFYTGLASKEVRQNFDVLAGKLRKIADSKSERTIYGYNDTVSTSVFTAEDIAGFKKTVSELKKRKQKIQDQVLEFNVRNEIVLDTATVSTLQVEGLV